MCVFKHLSVQMGGHHKLAFPPPAASRVRWALGNPHVHCLHTCALHTPATPARQLQLIHNAKHARPKPSSPSPQKGTTTHLQECYSLRGEVSRQAVAIGSVHHQQAGAAAVPGHPHRVRHCHGHL